LESSGSCTHAYIQFDPFMDHQHIYIHIEQNWTSHFSPMFFLYKKKREKETRWWYSPVHEPSPWNCKRINKCRLSSPAPKKWGLPEELKRVTIIMSRILQQEQKIRHVY